MAQFKVTQKRAMTKLTYDILTGAEPYLNPIGDRTLDLRSLGIDMVDNLYLTKVNNNQ